MQALGALREVVAEAGDASSEVGLHSLRIGATNTLAAGMKCCRGQPREKADGMLQRFPSTYIRNNPEDARIVSCKSAEAGKIGQRQPGQGTVLGLTP